MSSSEADNKLKAQFLLPVNKKAQNYKEWRNRDLFSDDQLTLQPKLQAEFFSSIAVGLLRLLFEISEFFLRILIFFNESFSVERGPEDLLGLYSELPRNHNI